MLGQFSMLLSAKKAHRRVVYEGDNRGGFWYLYGSRR